MRLEFEPNVTAIPLVENEMFDEVTISQDFQALLKKGIAAAQKGDREQARTLLVNAAQFEPKSEDAWMWLASISDYPEELLAFLNNVLNINPDNQRATEWRTATCSLLAKTFVQRGIEAHNEGSSEKAEQCFEQALVYDNECESAWFQKASFAESDDQKVEFLRRVLSINAENHEAQEMLDALTRSRSTNAVADAKAAALAGKHKKAIEIIGEALQSDPANIDAWILLSHLSANLKDKLHSLEKALEIDPSNAVARSSYDFLSVADVPVTEAKPVIDHAVAPEVTETAEPEVEAAVEAVPEEISEPEPASIHETEADTLHITEPEPEPEFVSDEQAPVAVDLFGAVDGELAQQDTAESLPPLDEILEADAPSEDMSVDLVHDDNVTAIFDQPDEHESTAAFAAPDAITETTPVSPIPGVACPFCSTANEPQAFECSTCHATLTLSDIESILSNSHADREVIRQAVTQMEAEWNMREFDGKELTALGIGHLNLQNFESGIKYLQEALRLDSNNVILSGQLNTLAIRLDEVRRQNESHESMPKGRTILVVDDSATVRKLISGKLEKSGHTVVCAEDGVEGLAKIAETLPDLVLLDITMPRMDGYEVCKQIRANPASKDVPVVMISGKDGFFDKVRGRMAGTTAYVTKPFGPETLMKALETYLVQTDGSVE